MTSFAVLVLALIFATGLSVHRRCPLLMRSAFVLGANAILCNLAMIATDSYAPALWFAAIDAVSAVILLWHPAGRTQAILGVVYIFQIALHFAQWVVSEGSAYDYLSVLTVGGGLQIAFLILGAIDGDGRKIRSGGGGGGGNRSPLAYGASRMEAGGGQ